MNHCFNTVDNSIVNGNLLQTRGQCSCSRSEDGLLLLLQCGICVEERLSKLRTIRNDLLLRHAKSKKALLTFQQQQQQQQQQQEKIQQMRESIRQWKECNEELVMKKLVPLQNQNDLRQQQYDDTTNQLQRGKVRLSWMKTCVVWNMEEEQKIFHQKIRSWQYKWCICLYKNYRVTLDSYYGKIGGLPLPHAGPSLYGALPSTLVSSSLYLVASLVHFLSQSLNLLPLPHPIAFQLIGSNKNNNTSRHSLPTNHSYEKKYIPPLVTLEELSQLQQQQQQDEEEDAVMDIQTPPTNNHNNYSNYLAASGLLTSSHLVSSAISAMKKTWKTTSSSSHHHHSTKQQFRTNSNSNNHKLLLQQQKSNIHQPSSLYRIVTEGTCCAILCEKSPTSNHNNVRHTTTNNNKNSMEYKLQPDNGEEYSTALQLLQNNIIALCIRSGVPAQSLYPAEAMLLNIHALIQYCQEQLQQKTTHSDENIETS